MFVLAPVMMMSTTSSRVAPTEEAETLTKVPVTQKQKQAPASPLGAKKSSATVSSSSSLSSTETEASSQRQSRKRVRFAYDVTTSDVEEYDDDETSSDSSSESSSEEEESASALHQSEEERPTKRPRREQQLPHRVLDWLPVCSELTLAEKQQRWLTSAEQEEIRRQRSSEAAAVRQQDACLAVEGQAHLSYTSTYSLIYAICNRPTVEGAAAEMTETSETTATTTAELLPDLLTFLGTGHHADTRGLEDRTVPWLAVERRLARATAIRAIVQTSAVHNKDEAILRRMSRTLSRPARRLGEALAVADATAAMVEYASSTESATTES